jgi:hypothetical protein
MDSTTPPTSCTAVMSKSTPITVLTGFLGAGKTSMILSILQQLPPDYKVVVLKNEFGDVEGKLTDSSTIDLTVHSRVFRSHAGLLMTYLLMPYLLIPFTFLLSHSPGAVDSLLTSQPSIAGVSEILNGCVCCVLVGQMKTALLEIKEK